MIFVRWVWSLFPCNEPHPKVAKFTRRVTLQRAMATRNLSFEEILEEKPTLDELCEHIRIGGKWYQLGIQLKLNAKKLEGIHKLPDDSTYMFELWLDTKPDATRRQVVDALRKVEITVSHEYEQTLWKSISLPTSEYKNLLHVHLVINVILLVCLWIVYCSYYRNGYPRYRNKSYSSISYTYTVSNSTTR